MRYKAMVLTGKRTWGGTLSISDRMYGIWDYGKNKGAATYGRLIDPQPEPDKEANRWTYEVMIFTGGEDDNE